MNTQRVYLNVPFAEKDEAKRLGARWDPSARSWYILPHVDTDPFTRWLKNAAAPPKKRAMILIVGIMALTITNLKAYSSATTYKRFNKP
ncbi:DUF5710 domain-containing protein [Piscirickettsia litoralis]|uniref:DUF5710 domain-containing protein n=1 Tax=Piscirickettsia litoralis TaxID=1891921 RepID=UPI001F37453E|nr:DUF5710 domain-containing protein [Piscirickettsia litoralis]